MILLCLLGSKYSMVTDILHHIKFTYSKRLAAALEGLQGIAHQILCTLSILPISITKEVASKRKLNQYNRLQIVSQSVTLDIMRADCANKNEIDAI